MTYFYCAKHSKLSLGKYEHPMLEIWAPMLIMPDPEGNMSRNIKIFFCLICKLNHLFYKNAGTQWIYVLFCVFGHKSMIPEHLVQKLWLLEVKVLILPHPPLLVNKETSNISVIHNSIPNLLREKSKFRGTSC